MAEHGARNLCQAGCVRCELQGMRRVDRNIRLECKNGEGEAETPGDAWRSEVLVRPERDTLVRFSDLRVGPRNEMLVPQQQLRRYIIFDSTGRRLAVIGTRRV